MLEWTPEEASLLHAGSTFSGSLLQRRSTHRQYRFQNGLEMEKHPRCSVKTLMHAKNA